MHPLGPLPLREGWLSLQRSAPASRGPVEAGGSIRVPLISDGRTLWVMCAVSQHPSTGTNLQLPTVLITSTHTLYWRPSPSLLTFPLRYWHLLLEEPLVLKSLPWESASGGTQPEAALHIEISESVEATSRDHSLLSLVNVGPFFLTRKANLVSL